MIFKPLYERDELHPKSADYAVVIPVINEGERLHALLTRMQRLNIQEEYDVIIVDGGSTDGSLEHGILQHFQVNTLLTRVSPGALGTQLQCAYDFVLEREYKGVITIDGNNKDDPEAIPRFKERLGAGVDFVQGSRFIEGGHHENTPLLRLLAVRLIHAPLLSIASGFRWTDTTQGFRGYSRILLGKISRIFTVHENPDYSFLFGVSAVCPKVGLVVEELGTTRIYPRTGGIPTKIRGPRSNFELLRQLIQSARLGMQFYKDR
jgi:dolichol-phosphate mannosyltransferase